jgi:chromosome segregation ATPase
MLKPLQDEFRRQLIGLDESLRDSLTDAKRGKTTLAAFREDIGVTLYNFQQLLLSSKATLDNAIVTCTAFRAARERAESDLRNSQSQLAEASERYDRSVAQFELDCEEMHRLDGELYALEVARQTEISELVVQRQIAHKAEAEIAAVEMSKNDQDFFIDGIVRRCGAMQQEADRLGQQISAQRAESKLASVALTQAELEEQKLEFERRQLLADLESASAGVRFRMRTLEDLRTAVGEQEEKAWELRVEIRGLKEDIKEKQREAEQLVAVQRRIDMRIRGLDAKIDAVKGEKAKIANQLQAVETAINLREQGNAEMVIGIKRAKADCHRAVQEGRHVLEQIEQVQEEIEASKEDQKVKIRAFLAAERLAIPVRRRLDAKNSELSALQNERIKLNIDKMAADNEVDRLKNHLKEIEAKLNDQNKQLDTCERELQENNAAIDKNLGLLERLNVRYKTCQAKKPSVEENPFQFRITDLQTKIRDATEQSKAKQEEFVKSQTRFLEDLKKCDELERQTNETRTKIAQLERRRDKAQQQLEALQKENQKYLIHVRVFQKELDRLNAQKGGTAAPNQETGALDALADREKEAIDLKRRIEETDRKRNELAEQRLQVEKQIILVEHNIKLAEEVAEKFDRSQNERELELMRNEIKKTEVRLLEIRRQTEVLTQKLEVLAKNKENLPKASGDDQLKEELASLRTEIDENEKQIKQDQTAQAAKKPEMNQLQEFVAEYKSQAAGFRRIVKDQQRLHTNLVVKLEQVTMQNECYAVRKHVARPGMFEHEFKRLRNQGERLLDFIDEMRDTYPEIADNFQVIRDRLAIALVG